MIRRCAVVCMVMVASPLVARGPVPSCDIGGGDVVSIKQITPQFELALDDGRVLKLPGLNPLFVRENATVAAITAELQARAKTDVVLACEISPLPDRWGRILAQVAFVSQSGEPEALAPIILAQGGAMVKPEGEVAQCKDAYLALKRRRANRPKACGATAALQFIRLPCRKPWKVWAANSSLSRAKSLATARARRGCFWILASGAASISVSQC